MAQSKNNWPEVTPDRRCPICDGNRRCKMTDDGAVRCFRSDTEALGYKLNKRHSGGGATFLPEGQSPRRRRTNKAALTAAVKSESAVVSESDLDRIYDYVVGLHRLTTEHRDSLHSRGFTDEAIKNRGYASKPKGNCAAKLRMIRNSVVADVFDLVPGLTRRGDVGMIAQPGILIPVRNPRGKIVALKLRLDKPGKGSKYVWISSRSKNSPDAPSPGAPIHVPLGITQQLPVLRLRITEGPIKADLCMELGNVPTISIPGVSIWSPAIAVARELGAKTICFAFDADFATNPNVAKCLLAAMKGFIAEGFAIELEQWPLSDAKGIDDLLALDKKPVVLSGEEALAVAGKAVETAESAIVAATDTESENTNGLPEIEITTDEPAVNDQAIKALETDPDIYSRGNKLACILRDEKQLQGIVRPHDAPRIAILHQATLREKMAGSAIWIELVETKDGSTKRKPAHPPEWSVKQIDARGHWPGIRPIEGVTESPIFRSDGTVLITPGYDAETGLFYEPRCVFAEIPERPTLDDAIRARDMLLEVVADFPFDLDAHRSGWLAGLLTPLTRYAFHGPSPMFTFDANTRGAGKTLLADAIGEINCGCPMARMINPESDDEMRKRITTLAIEGERMVLLDNLGNTLGSPSLDAALTATTWKDRILGVNRSTAAVPLKATWYATGNNIEFNGDTIRRVVPIRIESDLEKPEERTGFRHPNLLTWIRQERGRLVVAALTILRAYHVAGRPDQGLATWGSYEAWSAAVRQPIVWVGLVDPADSREELAEQSDREAGSLRALLTGWQEVAGDEGMTVAEVFRLLDDNIAASRIEGRWPGHEPLKWSGLRAAIAEISGKPLGQLPSPRSFGGRLTHMRGKVVRGRRLNGRPDRTGAIVWKVEGAGTAGTAETIPALTPVRTHSHAHTRERTQEERLGSPFTPSSPSSGGVAQSNGNGRTSGNCQTVGAVEAGPA